MDPVQATQITEPNSSPGLPSLVPPPPPPTDAVAVADHNLHPVQTTQFKKVRKPRTRKKSTHNTESYSSSSAWPTFKSKPKKLSSKEQWQLAAKNAHHNGLKVLVAFFRSNNNNNADSDSDCHPDEDDDDSMDEDNGQDKFGFFDKKFEEDTKMRDYYRKSFAEGEFSCLVCSSLGASLVGGKKMKKKFKGCRALVHHSIAIAKTKRSMAHRAFGEAVCKVLGWDVTNLSSIDSSSSKETDSVGSKGISNDEAVPEIGLIGAKILPNGDEGDNDMEDPSAHGLTNEAAHQDSENAGSILPHHLQEAGKYVE